MELQKSELEELVNFVRDVRLELVQREVTSLMNTIGQVLHVLEEASEPRRIRGYVSGVPGSSWEYDCDFVCGVALVDRRTDAADSDDVRGSYAGDVLYFIPDSLSFIVHYRTGRWSVVSGEPSSWQEEAFTISAIDAVKEYGADAILLGVQQAIMTTIYRQHPLF